MNTNVSLNTVTNLHSPESKLIHIDQSTGSRTHRHVRCHQDLSVHLEYSYIAIAIIKGKMLSVAIHVPSCAFSSASVLENGDTAHAEKNGDDTHPSNPTSSLLNSDKEIPLASLSTARCGFGITSTDETIYAVGRCRSSWPSIPPIDV